MKTAAILLLTVWLPCLKIVSGYSVQPNLSPDDQTELLDAGRSVPVSLLPLALVLVGPALALALGTLKPVLLALGLLYLVVFWLSSFPVVGTLLEVSFRAFSASVSDYLPPSFGNDLLHAAGLDSGECLTRAVCKITEEAVRQYPAIDAMLRSLTGALQAHGSNQIVIKGLLGGLSGLGCESLYSECAHSPLDRLFGSLSPTL